MDGFKCKDDKCCPAPAPAPGGGRKGAFNLTGGGAYLAGSTKSVIRCDVCGDGTCISSACNSPAGSMFAGSLSAFNYGTRALIDMVAFSALQTNLLGGGDLSFSGMGTANVNNILTNIEFFGSKIAGVSALRIQNAANHALLAGGTGETGLADLGLTIET